MQEKNEKITQVKNAIGRVLNKIRLTGDKKSLTRFAYEYEIDKGSLSKLERGVYDCRISTAIKLAEANGLKFSEFAKLIENELGENFKFIDE